MQTANLPLETSCRATTSERTRQAPRQLRTARDCHSTIPAATPSAELQPALEISSAETQQTAFTWLATAPRPVWSAGGKETTARMTCLVRTMRRLLTERPMVQVSPARPTVHSVSMGRINTRQLPIYPRMNYRVRFRYRHGLIQPRLLVAQATRRLWRNGMVRVAITDCM